MSTPSRSRKIAGYIGPLYCPAQCTEIAIPIDWDAGDRLSTAINCLIPHNPDLSNGRQFENRFLCSLHDSNMSLCRAGGAYYLHKEDDLEFGGGIVADVVALRKVAISTRLGFKFASQRRMEVYD